MHIELQKALETNPNNGYLRYHMPRFSTLFDAVSKYTNSNEAAILDIGKSPFTDALIEKFAKVDTLGFNSDEKTSTGDHYEFDLNHTREQSLWRKDLPQYDLIVFSEVIEHLYTSPNHVFPFLKSLLKKSGYLLVQTPNAVAIHKRIKMLLGRNPYELIREDHENPGHYREYTQSELANYLEENGFTIEHFSYGKYFDYQYSNHAFDGNTLIKDKKREIFNLLFSIIPGFLKPGMFFVTRKV